MKKGKYLLFMEGLKHKSKFIAATSQVSLQQTPTVKWLWFSAGMSKVQDSNPDQITWNFFFTTLGLFDERNAEKRREKAWKRAQISTIYGMF